MILGNKLIGGFDMVDKFYIGNYIKGLLDSFMVEDHCGSLIIKTEFDENDGCVSLTLKSKTKTKSFLIEVKEI
jgi:hypothetical protein